MSQHSLQGRTDDEVLWFQRRGFLQAAAAWSAMGGFAAAQAQSRSNIVELRGDALLNGSRLLPEQTIQTGDEIVTGPQSNLVFVVGNASFQVRQNSRLSVERGSTLNAVSAQIPVGLNLDGDGDGFVDHISFEVYSTNANPQPGIFFSRSTFDTTTHNLARLVHELRRHCVRRQRHRHDHLGPLRLQPVRRDPRLHLARPLPNLVHMVVIARDDHAVVRVGREDQQVGGGGGVDRRAAEERRIHQCSGDDKSRQHDQLHDGVELVLRQRYRAVGCGAARNGLKSLQDPERPHRVG